MSSVSGSSQASAPSRAAGERRIGTGEQPDLAVERPPDDVLMVLVRIGASGEPGIPARSERPMFWLMAPLLQSDAMVVSASSARDRTVPAATLVAIRGGSPVRAGSWPEDADDLVTPWHTHELHQLLYTFEGVVEVETAGAHHLLPPQQAAWIPAGLAHQTTLRRVRSGAVFFDPAMVPDRGDRVRVLAAVAPIREMIVYAMRWRIDRPSSDPTADAFFEALALLAAEWLDSAEAPLRLPTGNTPTIQAIMAHTQAHLDRRQRRRRVRRRRPVGTLAATAVPAATTG